MSQLSAVSSAVAVGAGVGAGTVAAVGRVDSNCVAIGDVTCDPFIRFRIASGIASVDSDAPPSCVSPGATVAPGLEMRTPPPGRLTSMLNCSGNVQIEPELVDSTPV